MFCNVWRKGNNLIRWTQNLLLPFSQQTSFLGGLLATTPVGRPKHHHGDTGGCFPTPSHTVLDPNNLLRALFTAQYLIILVPFSVLFVQR